MNPHPTSISHVQGNAHAQALYLLLTAGGVHYAMRATRIRRLVPYVKLHAPPSHAPREFVGWLNWQGELIPVVDGTLRLAGRPTAPTLISRILLVQNDEHGTETSGGTIGIIAECAHKTARLSSLDFKSGMAASYAAAAAGAHASSTELVTPQIPLLPVMEYEGELLHLLELAHLLTPELYQAFNSPSPRIASGTTQSGIPGLPGGTTHRALPHHRGILSPER